MLSEEIFSTIRKSGATRLVVGFSGGIDSHVLLHSLARSRLETSIHALHINHGLSPFADAWQAHCAEVCARLDVEFTAMSVSVQPGTGVEERSRDARYAAFVGFLRPNDLLLLAHHADDQVETALLTLLRGGNKPGFSGMPRERTIGKSRLLRPLLEIDRATIEKYAQRHDLAWIVDRSNEDTGLNRNYLRHRVLPAIRARWPDIAKTVARELARDEEFSQLIDYIGKIDLERVVSGRGGIFVSALGALQAARRKNVIRCWVASFGLPLPGDAVLAELPALLEAAEDATPLITWQKVCLRRSGDEVFLTSIVGDFDASASLTFSGAQVVDTGAGTLTADFVKGRGLVVSILEDLTVRFRRGGERIRMGRNRKLKNIFQEAGVPAWLRDCLPLVYKDDELVAVAGLPAFGIAMRAAGAWRAGPGQAGVEFSFEAPGQPYTH